jgi:glutamyl endopeptidase
LLPRILHTTLPALAVASLLAGGLATAGPVAAAVETAPARQSALPPDALVSKTGRVVTPTEAAQKVTGAEARGRSGFTGRAPSSGEPESIIGTDDRAQVTPTTSYPARAIGLINRNGVLHCTGWLISRDTILTAGHCVHTGGSAGTWYSGLTFRVGSDGNTAPYGTCSPRGTWALNGWLNSGDTRYDAGIIKLNCTVGNTVGWFGMWWQSASLNGLATVVQGYPGDKPSTQWQSTDSVRASETENLFYQNDTVGGMSGSPVYQSRPSGSSFCSGVCAMAIHTNGVGGSGSSATNNSGNRITQAKYNSYVSIINTP